MKLVLKKLVREDNFLSLLGNLILALLGFGGFAILARSLDIEEFAKWVLFISGGSMFEMLRYGITNNGLVRFLSGAKGDKRDQLIGSNVLLSLFATLILTFLLIVINNVIGDYIYNSPYSLFFQWYPVLAFFNLPFNNALVVQQANLRYDRILIIKAINSGLFFGFLIVNTFIFQLSIFGITKVFLLINALTSVICIIRSWDGLKLIMKGTKSTIKTLLHFGKYSTFTLIGTNLLRNADILIISISPFGSAAVSLFSIPLKLTEIQQIPLRSFTATAFPKMSKESLDGNLTKLKSIFSVYTGALTYLFCSISVFTFVFAEECIFLISGNQYLNISGDGISIVTIVKILSIYGLLLPLDRMTGIALDSLNKPHINALKVIIMVGTNVIGDFIAIYVFKSIELVAISTLVFTVIGIILGIYFLNKTVRISLIEVFKCGFLFYKNMWMYSKGHIMNYQTFNK